MATWALFIKVGVKDFIFPRKYFQNLKTLKTK
jgi:hypothetical protein